MLIILLISAFLGIILFEVPGLIQKQYWRELVVFSAFLLFAFIVSLLQVLGVKLPNPNTGIEQLIKGVMAFFHK
jgi:hypothetical protein